MSLTASSRFGFLSAEIASFNSASTFAFFCAFRSVPLKLILRAKRLDGLSLSELDSGLGIKPISDESLASRFSPGITVWVADRSSAIVAAGPRETLRLLRSTERARSRALSLSCFKDIGRLTGAPGLTLTAEAGFAAFSLGGDCATGPPSLRLRESQCAGRRAEKLLKSVSQRMSICRVHTTYNGTMISTQKSLRGSELARSGFSPSWPSAGI